MIPHSHRISDISDDVNIISHSEHRKRQRLDKNVHFDQMIQSMSAVDRDKHHRKEQPDAYSPSKSTKTPSPLRSSSASKLSSESSSSHHPCNPLPQWLVNTLLTLSKKNPLRLLLPPNTSEDSGILLTQTKNTAQPIDVSATSPPFTFHLPEPKAQKLFALPQSTLITENDQEIWPEPLPFSTPGPGSLLGSSMASNTAFSLPIPKNNLSLVPYANETHIGSDLHSNHSHTLVYSSDPLSSDPIYYDPRFEAFATDEVGWNSTMLEEDRQFLFSNIYSTPGPRYCAPRPVHFDSPLEDSIQAGYEIDHDKIDFQWKPFDRKNLVVPDRFQKPIYASDPADSNDAASNASEYQSIKPADIETNTLNSHTSPRPASALLSISPTPFRFLLPPESDDLVPVPESQVQHAAQKASTPKKSPYFAVPGIYISPLDGHRKVYDTATVKKHGSEFYPGGEASKRVKRANSQASTDSIESWEENLL